MRYILAGVGVVAILSSILIYGALRASAAESRLEEACRWR